MRVGLDASPLAFDPGRGVARGVLGWIRGLDAVLDPSDEVVVFLPGEPGEAAVPADLAAAPGRDGPARRTVEFAGPGTRTPRAMRRRLPHLIGRRPLDVFLSPWQAFPALPVPVVATVHELPFLHWGPVEGRLAALAQREWLRRDARRCAALVTPSRATRDDVLRLHPDASARVHVVPHAFDPEPWRSPAEAGAGESAGRPRAVLVGCTHRRKGVHVWIGALPRLADLGIAWTLVGEPREAALRRPLLAHPDVLVLAAADDAILRARLAGASVLVYPSLCEGFGFPPLEAMAAGVPVVASATGSIPEVCGDAALLVPPGDPVALAEGIRRVLTDGATRASLVERGRERCRGFPAEATGRRLLEVLREAAGGRP